MSVSTGDDQRTTAGGAAGTATRGPIGLRHHSLRQAVLDELRRAIITGLYRPGDRLLEEEVARELDVSRNPVREALQGLAMEGFVEIEPRRGARVSIFTAERAEKLFEIRQPLEGLVAQLAATRRTSAQLAQLSGLVDEGLTASQGGFLTDLPELNTRFHTVLAEAADNEFLADTLNRMSHLIQWVYSSRIQERSDRSWREHRQIVQAIADQDADAAYSCAFTHIVNARNAYLAAPANGGH